MKVLDFYLVGVCSYCGSLLFEKYFLCNYNLLWLSCDWIFFATRYFFGNTWKKKSESCFDVTMGSHDGAEECELGGIFILSHLTKHLKQNDVGLYRDDSLIVVKSLNDQQTEKLKKIIIKVFKSFGLKIKIKTNLIEVFFLDVTFSLIKGTVQPYKNPNNNLSYQIQ